VVICRYKRSLTSSLGRGIFKFHLLKWPTDILSTGGIIALGLGVEDWTVEQCIGKFTSLCGDAFNPRELLGVPLLGKLSMVNHRSMYKTKPFEKALQ